MIPAASKWWAESNVRLKTSDVESVFKLKACCLKRIIVFFFLCFNTLHKKAHTNTHTNGSEVKIERRMGLNQSQRHKMDESQFFWTESQLLLRSLCEEHVVQNDQTECKKLQSQCLLTYCVRFSRRVSAHSCIHVCWWLELSAITAAQTKRATLTFKAPVCSETIFCFYFVLRTLQAACRTGTKEWKHLYLFPSE